MTATTTTELPDASADDVDELDAIMERACALIAPTWPLDRFIAVNPFWEMVDQPLPAVSSRLTALSGARLVMPRAWFREEWKAGRLRDADLEDAIAEAGAALGLADLHAIMNDEEPVTPRRARFMDIADSERDLERHMSWRDFVIHSSSQFCAAYFDAGQARLAPSRDGGLYASWRRQAGQDRSPALLMGLRNYKSTVSEVPPTARAMARVALRDLEIPTEEYQSYLTGLLLDLNGWAAWCAYRRWTARLSGGTDDALVDLLGIRLAWEWVLHRQGGAGLALSWRKAKAAWPSVDGLASSAQTSDWLLQRASEIAWQRGICAQLPAGWRPRSMAEPISVQAAFCIDVRSEVFRRALERQAPRVQTMGFAGFFGLPIEYQPIGSTHARPQLPGLLAARFRVTDSGVTGEVAAQREVRLDGDSAWKSFKTSALSTFAFVESLGLLFGGKLIADSFGFSGSDGTERAGLTAAEHALRRPRLTAHADGAALALEDRCKLAEGMLRAMSLTRDFARLVVLVGHGSQTRNNPHAAGLDCGACCGQTGEVNARVAAALLNEFEVRAGLSSRGIDIPASTRFLAALHDTTTDHVTLYELDDVPASHTADLRALRGWLDGAAQQARRERAPRLGVSALSDSSVRAAIEQRAADWAQVRPEWGLANNAAFIIAPRSTSRHIDFAGRSFLHDYRFEDDPDFGILELIMTAPMVVTHWINLQYYASTVDNVRYGSGNKVLHNVVGGHLGVFEGNGGDLRIGLPMQSLHDGERWVHTPLRLSVFIEAPRAAIEGVLRKHEKVRALVNNEWIHLFQLDANAGSVSAYRRQAWRVVTSAR